MPPASWEAESEFFQAYGREIESQLMNSVAKIRQRLMQDWGTHWPFQLRFQIFCDKKEVRRCGTTLYKYLDLGFSRHQQHLWLSVLAFFTPEGFDATPMLEEA